MPLPSAEGVTAAAAVDNDIVVVYFAIRPACRRLVRTEGGSHLYAGFMRRSGSNEEERGALTKLERRSERIRYFFPLFPRSVVVECT